MPHVYVPEERSLPGTLPSAFAEVECQLEAFIKTRTSSGHKNPHVP
jgi:hypothetical protein